MDAEKLNQVLYDKMAAEQERFKHTLSGMTPEEVLDHAYEYAMREDILMEMEKLDLSAPEAAALLESPSPLADVYGDFREREGHMDLVRECIETLAYSLLETQREKNRAIPLYLENAGYARDHGELDMFWASQKANIACRDAIEAAIRERGTSDSVKRVLAQFGSERVSYVLAVTLLERREDERLSRETVAWAMSVPIGRGRARCSDYAISSHTYHLDDFTTLARMEMETARGQSAKKPSIKGKLAAKPVPGERSAKPKDKDKGVR